MMINRPGLQFRIIVILLIWIAFVSYGLITTFLNDYWIQQWAANNALSLAGTIFTLCFCSLFLLVGFKTKKIKVVTKNEKQEKEIKKQKAKKQIREI